MLGWNRGIGCAMMTFSHSIKVSLFEVTGSSFNNNPCMIDSSFEISVSLAFTIKLTIFMSKKEYIRSLLINPHTSETIIHLQSDDKLTRRSAD